KYANLIARCGANVQKGQEVLINAELDQPEFVKMVVEECYKAGAKDVTVEWSYHPLSKINVRYRSLKTMSTIEDWQLEKLKYRTKTLPCMLHISSADPDGLKGINQEKMTKASRALYPIQKPYIDEMDCKYQWCIAAVPGEAWAKKVFPGMRTSAAVEKMWEAILKTSRADGDDPIAAWNEHNENLKKKFDYLNSLSIKSLHYTSSNGTDLKVGLIPGAQFMGGGENALGSGIFFNPNIPSEEIFTTPMRGKAEGIVYSAKPLSYRGELIENFSVRFENGKAVEVKAEKNEELLKTMISMDENAGYLGEVALIPYNSPINDTGILFYNTLFDENASCHLALGRGFKNVLPGYENMSEEELLEKGINNSMIHVDFMIGSKDLSIAAETFDGKTIDIFKDGNWAF
ncbi:MAG: aminopeptidase, partial [Clostridia bacterium]|nr:aminopeptidase [Clostridia bacterium]